MNKLKYFLSARLLSSVAGFKLCPQPRQHPLLKLITNSIFFPPLLISLRVRTHARARTKRCVRRRAHALVAPRANVAFDRRNFARTVRTVRKERKGRGNPRCCHNDVLPLDIVAKSYLPSFKLCGKEWLRGAIKRFQYHFSVCAASPRILRLPSRYLGCLFSGFVS